MPARVIGEQQGAGRAFAGLHISEVFLADQLGQSFADRQEQRFRRSPAARAFKAEAASGIVGHNPPEAFVACEQQVQGLEFLEVCRLERAAFARPHKNPEPLTQAARLVRDAVEFAAEAPTLVDWLVEGAIPKGVNGIICGDPKASKSFHAVDLAMSLACGVDWLGMRVPRRVRAATATLDR